MSDADELNILIPDGVITVGGVAVTVHEYTFEEQLRFRATLRPVIDAIAGLFTGPDSAEGVDLEHLTDVLAGVHGPVVDAVAIASGQSREWVASLTGTDAENLLLTWWGVNAGFFIRQATLPQMQKLVQSLSAGVTSSLS